MKECLRWMCLERERCCGLYARSIADLLSRCSGVALLLRSPSSLSNVRRHAASLAASDAAMISASQDDSATEGCF
eukprot:1258084-Pleurochrysis_carterae.AAC.1